MFIVYHSNQLDLLKTLTATLMTDQPTLNPFQSEFIIVQNNGIAQWIQIELATQLGIAANIQFPLPAKFIWQMFTRVLPNIPKESAFSKSEMVWKLMKILPLLYQYSDQHPEFTSISKYLHDDINQYKAFQLASQVAELFDQYMVYRPNWLESWQNYEIIEGIGEPQYWQAQVWRMLIEETKRIGQSSCHYADLRRIFIKKLKQVTFRPTGLPSRIFVFGISGLPPSYLEILQLLGRHIDVHLFFANPCRYYWGDNNDNDFFKKSLCKQRQYHQKIEKGFFYSSEKTSEIFSILEERNPLLSSWGKQGSDTVYFLTQMDNITEVDAFVDPTNENLLSLIQCDILSLKDCTVLRENEKLKHRKEKRVLQPDDSSICIHVCHSPQREIEVLYDNLMEMMSRDTTLSPRDVIVMTSDIDSYVPAIQAVFGNSDHKDCIPFSISDRPLKNLHPIISAFFNLIDVLRSRFTTNQVLELLEVPALATHFSINEKEVQILRDWVVESGIRWGLDDNMLSELMLPTSVQHTWQFGLNRMLLGYAMESKSGEWKGIFPYDTPNSSITNLVGQLAEFIMHLRKWRDWLIRPHFLHAWVNFVKDIINDFFTPNSEEKEALTLMRNQWKEVLKYALQAGYDKPIPIIPLYNDLVSRLNQELISHSFLNGGINFCTIMPMRSIPFRIICLLGMNDGTYPRMFPSLAFDLMVQKPQRGDRSRRDDDRYLFLETLLSAQQQFYISFIGLSIQDNSLRYPSVLVNELSNYIEQSCYLAGDTKTDEKISINRVREHLWQWHDRIPFISSKKILSERNLKNFENKNLAITSLKNKLNSDFFVSLPTSFCEHIEIDELIRFYHHPVRFWFIRRLGISFCRKNITLITDEPFCVDDQARYQLNKRLINALINRENTDKLFLQLRASGLLPHGIFGELYWAQQYQEMMMLSKLVQHWQSSKTYSCKICLKLDHITLHGQIKDVQENGLLRWCPRKLSLRDGLMLWLEHLVYCAIGGQGDSRMFGVHSSWHFPSLTTSKAKEFLISLISGYCNGMIVPLLLLFHSGNVWLNHCYNSVTQSIDWNEIRQKQAREKIIQVWQGNNFHSGERNDPYLQRLIGQLEIKHIKAIILATKQYLLPPFALNLTQKTFKH